MVHFLGKWVIFYHTGGNEFGGTINTGTKRVTGAEYFDFNKSGNPWTIPQLKKLTGWGFLSVMIQFR